jgi:hypothetical protein
MYPHNHTIYPRVRVPMVGVMRLYDWHESA